MSRALWDAVRQPLANTAAVEVSIDALCSRVGLNYAEYCREHGKQGDDVEWSSDDDR